MQPPSGPVASSPATNSGETQTTTSAPNLSISDLVPVSSSTEAANLLKENSNAREELLLNAVRFLLHPSVQDASAIKKQQFLKQKGLTDEEINEAFRRFAAIRYTQHGNASQPSTLPFSAERNAASAPLKERKEPVIQAPYYPSSTYPPASYASPHLPSTYPPPSLVYPYPYTPMETHGVSPSLESRSSGSLFRFLRSWTVPLLVTVGITSLASHLWKWYLERTHANHVDASAATALQTSTRKSTDYHSSSLSIPTTLQTKNAASISTPGVTAHLEMNELQIFLTELLYEKFSNFKKEIKAEIAEVLQMHVPASSVKFPPPALHTSSLTSGSSTFPSVSFSTSSPPINNASYTRPLSATRRYSTRLLGGTPPLPNLPLMDTPSDLPLPVASAIPLLPPASFSSSRVPSGESNNLGVSPIVFPSVPKPQTSISHALQEFVVNPEVQKEETDVVETTNPLFTVAEVVADRKTGVFKQPSDNVTGRSPSFLLSNKGQAEENEGGGLEGSFPQPPLILEGENKEYPSSTTIASISLPLLGDSSQESKEKEIWFAVNNIATHFMQANTSTTPRKALGTLTLILKNIIHSPSLDKYKKLNVDSPRFEERFGTSKMIGFEFLEVLGFQKKGKVYEYNSEDLFPIELAYKILSSFIKAIEESPNGSEKSFTGEEIISSSYGNSFS